MANIKILCCYVTSQLFFAEVLRKFPAVLRLERLCVKEYKIPELGATIPKGTIVGIPVHAIHSSKEYYANPDKFDPEHFRPDVKEQRSPYAYMPFGIGPRNCIGMYFLKFYNTDLSSLVKFCRNVKDIYNLICIYRYAFCFN